MRRSESELYRVVSSQPCFDQFAGFSCNMAKRASCRFVSVPLCLKHFVHAGSYSLPFCETFWNLCGGLAKEPTLYFRVYISADPCRRIWGRASSGPCATLHQFLCTGAPALHILSSEWQRIFQTQVGQHRCEKLVVEPKFQAKSLSKLGTTTSVLRSLAWRPRPACLGDHPPKPQHSWLDLGWGCWNAFWDTLSGT